MACFFFAPCTAENVGKEGLIIHLIYPRRGTDIPTKRKSCWLDPCVPQVPSMSGVGSLVEGEDSDRVLAQVALVSGVTIGPQVWSPYCPAGGPF